MCGGDPEAYAPVLPYLQAEGKQLYLLGPKAGVDPKALYEIISGATGGSRQIERSIPKFIFPGRFDAVFKALRVIGRRSVSQ